MLSSAGIMRFRDGIGTINWVLSASASARAHTSGRLLCFGCCLFPHVKKRLIPEVTLLGHGGSLRSESLVGGLETTEGMPLRKCETLVPSLSLLLPDSLLCLLPEVQAMVLPCLGPEALKL